MNSNSFLPIMLIPKLSITMVAVTHAWVPSSSSSLFDTIRNRRIQSHTPKTLFYSSSSSSSTSSDDYSYSIYPDNIDRFCEQMGCTEEDYEEMVYKLKNQRDALSNRLEIIDEVLVSLQGTIDHQFYASEEDMTRLVDKTRQTLEVERLQFVTNQCDADAFSETGSPRSTIVIPDLDPYEEQDTSDYVDDTSNYVVDDIDHSKTVDFFSQALEDLNKARLNFGSDSYL